jgi:predicted ThiF/HesA family dinucleotide-utilizing enzyme
MRNTLCEKRDADELHVPAAVQRIERKRHLYFPRRERLLVDAGVSGTRVAKALSQAARGAGDIVRHIDYARTYDHIQGVGVL